LAPLFWGNREWSLRSQAPPPAFSAISLVRKSATLQVDRVSLRRPHSRLRSSRHIHCSVNAKTVGAPQKPARERGPEKGCTIHLPHLPVGAQGPV